MIIGGFLVLVIVVLFGGAFIYNKFFYKRSYSEVENIMLEATHNYFNHHKDALPQNINDTVTLTESDLVAAEEMKSISEYLKEESTSCEGKVSVTNINGTYRYTPSLNCGAKYNSQTLIDYIKSNVQVVENGNGLYNLNDELVYRGDNVKNYLKFSGKMYRIVKFSDNQPVIILAEKLETMNWDNRYNIEKKDTSGINDYSVSRVKEYLDNLYKGNKFITTNDKTLVTAHSLAIGKRSDSETDKTGNIEKSAIIENQFIGLLPMYDYLNASLDSNCTTTTSPSCVNYNYLTKFSYNWWTMTGTSTNTYRVYRVNKNATLTPASSNAYVRPVLYLAKDSLYVSGNGTSEQPYQVK